MSETASSSVANPTRGSRLLWANVYCLLDSSSGASASVRVLLRQLMSNGYDVSIIGATIFDHERGATRLQQAWEEIQKRKGGVVNIQDDALLHRLVVTARTQRAAMTSKEEAVWFSLYRTVLDEFKPDVVFYYGGQPLDMLLAAEARYRGIPTVALLVNGNFAGQRWCRDVDLIITDSQATADMYERTQGYKAVPVGYFIDPATVVANNHSRERLLFVNPSLEKGVGIIVLLALLLEKRRPDIVFEVVESRGSWQKMLELISNELGTSRKTLANVVVTPNTADMRPIYGRARLLLAPSLCWESAGLVVGEAMLNGIPAIVTDRGGMPEMIQNGGLKLQLPTACYEKPYMSLPKTEMLEPLIAEIIKLYDDEDYYAGYAEKARQVGQTFHGLDTSTRRVMEALQPLVERRAGDVDAGAATAVIGPATEWTQQTTRAKAGGNCANSDQPKISVIFPVAEREVYLREALESVLAQTFADFELLIILDGVSPAIESIIDSYSDDRIRKIRFPLNLGISTARNAGMRSARAPLIALMDSDDVSMPERFARQYAWMEAHPDVTVCATNSIKLLRDGRRVSMRYPETDGMIKSRLLIVDSALLNPTTMFRTDFIRQHGLEYDPSLPRDNDHRLFVEMMRKGARFYGLQEELLLYRRHGGNATTDQTGVDEEKTRVREVLLPLFYPELTGEAYRILLKGMCNQVQFTADEAENFTAFYQQAMRESRSFVGEDRNELRRILTYYQQRALAPKNLNRKL